MIEDLDGLVEAGADPPGGARPPAASSTRLPSSNHKVTVGSNAAAATRSDRATDLPRPGSPPSLTSLALWRIISLVELIAHPYPIEGVNLKRLRLKSMAGELYWD
jgi:hypothetical protein